MGHPSAFRPSPSEPFKRQLQVVVHAGPLAGKGFPITGNLLTFGRDADNDITLDDEQVSRHHARLIRDDDRIIIEDLGSMNGTLVNGQPIVGQHLLQPADIISIGSSVFGVKGFAAPQTVGLTQLSSEPPPYFPLMQQPPSAPVTPPPPISRSRPTPAEPSRLTLIAIGGAVALAVTILIVAIFTAYFLFRERNSPVASVPTVVITAPVKDSQVTVNHPVTIQATASDPAGVTRMELWVSGVKISEAASPGPGQATFTTSFQWTPQAPGSYTLEVKAYNPADAVNVPAIVTVNAVAEGGNTATPTVTPLPGTPTATVPTNPSLLTRADLNVRSGPGTQYDLLGLLPTGTAADIIGRDETRQWWQIRFLPAADGVGWVSADPTFAQVFNVENIPIVPAPPTPTGTPTNTPVPPTNTSTATAIPPTDTPTPTPTPTATTPSTSIQFNVSPTSIEGGQCAIVSWKIDGVKEIYIDGKGMGGEGQFEDCPKETKTYRLRVVKQDNSELTQDVTVQVSTPLFPPAPSPLNRIKP